MNLFREMLSLSGSILQWNSVWYSAVQASEVLWHSWLVLSNILRQTLSSRLISSLLGNAWIYYYNLRPFCATNLAERGADTFAFCLELVHRNM